MPNSLIYMDISYNLSNFYNHSPLDAIMNIKKLLATIVFALSAWTSVGVVQAQNATYDFTFTTDNGISASGSLIETSGIWNFGIGSTLTTSPGYSAGIYSANSSYVMSAPSNVDTSQSFSFDFVTLLTRNNTVDYFGGKYIYNNSSLTPPYTPPFLNANLDPGTSTFNLVSAAPEMNASFIPQVVLMLACLFFLFGRKKAVVETLLAA